MTTAEILKFLNDHPACHLATLENGRPRVRGMLMYRADERGLLFHTGTGKALGRQAQNGAAAEACFNSPETQIRVALYLDGTTVDFYEGIDRRGFMFENPNAVKSCGCGSSFQA